MSDPDKLVSPGRPAPPPSRSAALRQWLIGNPLVPPALGMAAGVLFDSRAATSVWLAPAVFVMCGLVLWGGGRLTRGGAWLGWGVLLVAGLSVGTALHDLAFRRHSPDHLRGLLSVEPVPGTLVCRLEQAPALALGGAEASVEKRTRLLVEAESLRTRDREFRVSGLVRVALRAGSLSGQLLPGARLELRGLLHVPQGPSNPVVYDFDLAERRRGVLVEMTCRNASDVSVLSAPKRDWLWSSRRFAVAAMLEDTYRGPEAGSQLLAALVLGQRSAVDRQLNDAFIDSGTVHYLSVSGAHVGMLIGVIWLAGAGLGLPRPRTALVAAVMVIAYGLLTEPSPPIHRSVVVSVLGCAAVILRRPFRTANWLAASLLVLLAIAPTQLFQAGFQLSYVTLVAVVYLSPRVYALGSRAWRRVWRQDDPLLSPEIQRRLNPSGWRLARDRVLTVLGQGLAVGVAAWLAGGLLGAYHFQRLSTWGWLNSLLIMPLVWLVMVIGLLKTALGAVVPWLAWLLGWPLSGLTDLLIAAVRGLARLPGSRLDTPVIEGWVVALGLGVLVLWLLRPWLRLDRGWLVAVGLGFSAILGWTAFPVAADRLRLHVLSVGDASTSVLELPGGRALIYDLGARPEFDLERWAVGPLLDLDHVRSVDAVLISHANRDHYSGVEGLLGARAVRAVLVPWGFGLRPGQEGDVPAVLRAAARRGALARGDRLEGTGSATIEVLWPAAGSEGLSENDACLVLRVSYAGRRILLCGDIEAKAMRALLATEDLRADVLVLPHHGSVQEMTAAFIRAVDPACCIRSSNRRDRAANQRLAAALGGRPCFNTAEDGAVLAEIRPDGLSVSGLRTPGAALVR